MRIDLHTHSSVSDGTDEPAALVRKAAAAGLDVVALTDHDTTAGWAAARAEAERVGIELVLGIEMSTTRRGRSVHLLAYGPDPTDAALVAAMASVIELRNARVPAIVAKLQALGVDLTVADVLGVAASATAAGRPHVADALVRAGVVGDRAEAFDVYLKPGRPAYVHREAAPLADVVRIVTRAGGAAVLAHPWGRGSADVLGADVLEDLRDSGLVGIEVDHEDHTPAQRTELRGLAADLGLVVTGSSDHHGLGKVGHGLGVNTTTPEEYEQLKAAVSAAPWTA